MKGCYRLDETAVLYQKARVIGAVTTANHGRNNLKRDILQMIFRQVTINRMTGRSLHRISVEGFVMVEMRMEIDCLETDLYRLRHRFHVWMIWMHFAFV